VPILGASSRKVAPLQQELGVPRIRHTNIGQKGAAPLAAERQRVD